MATCRGIDVSAYQATQDWTAHRRAGVVFAFAKASEGQHTHDPKFATHITGIKAAGLVPGAYHFSHPNQDVALEAANYISAVKPHAGTGFLHWLDLERLRDGSNYAGRTAAQIRAWAATWMTLVQEAFPGQRVGIYTSADDIAAGHVPTGVTLWYPAYPGASADTYAEAEGRAQPTPSGRSPLIWQFTSTPATGPHMDLNICYLSEAGLRAWAAGTTEETDMTPDQAAQLKALHDNLLNISSLTEKDTKGQPVVHGAGYYLAHTHFDALQIYALETAQAAAIAKLAQLVGSDVDTAAVVDAVQKAIADAVVKVSVNVTGSQS
jgi:GH25 family lysozyme M1 (1,4-beta-N-acetylmuramidase)